MKICVQGLCLNHIEYVTLKLVKLMNGKLMIELNVMCHVEDELKCVM